MKTGWTEATTDINRAMIGLISCLDAGYNAWIEIMKNGEQNFPIMIPNPALEDPFNWTMSYGIPRPADNFRDERFLNATQKDMTLNWTVLFGEREAAEHYQKTGELSKSNFKGMGYCHPVKIADINKFMEECGETRRSGCWATVWKPKDKIPYRVPANIEKVFTICYNDAQADKITSITAAGNFLLQYARQMIDEGAIC